MRIARWFMLGTLAMLTTLSLADVGRADSTASAATTQPLTRTIAVAGSASQRFTVGSEQSQREALTTATDGALADAKQKAERSAKILGVRLGPPITVGVPWPDERVSNVDPSARSRDAVGYITVSVNIVFELTP